MHENGFNLVYGGGSIGLMGIIAEEMLRLGGEVIGVIPKRIYDWEVGHTGITKLHIVRNMHERKDLMARLSSAFIALPGGVGTLEEIIEVFTWKQLGYHQKPCVFVNTNSYYDQLISFLSHCASEGFFNINHYKDLFLAKDEKEAVSFITNQLNV